jgi:translation initiation factor 1
MAQKNWKDILGSTLAGIPDIDSEKPTAGKKTKDSKTPGIRQSFIIRFEKRNGKPATIVSNFQGSEQELKDLAARLKKHCGVGGSAKDDEILIQGDVKDKIADFLRNQGHAVRGDLKK